MKWPFEVKLKVTDVKGGASPYAAGSPYPVTVTADSGRGLSPPHRIELVYLLDIGDDARKTVPHIGDTITITIDDDGVPPQ